MTEKVFEVTRDCIKKLSGVVPSVSEREEMLSFLRLLDRTAEIDDDEGVNGIKIEIGNWPKEKLYEKIFKEAVLKWLSGSSIADACDLAATLYLKADPKGYQAAICFSAVWSIKYILTDDLPYAFIDRIFQYLLPDGYRWEEENEKEKAAHKDDENWYTFMHDHRKELIGEESVEVCHRFDSIKISRLIDVDEMTRSLGKEVSEKLLCFGDGAIRLIMKNMNLHDFENSLFAVTDEAEERIFSNISTNDHAKIKGGCILKKDKLSPSDIRIALTKFKDAITAYDGDPLLEAEYDFLS